MPNFMDDPEAYPSPESVPAENVAPPPQELQPAQMQARVDEAYAQMEARANESAQAAKEQLDLMNEARTRFAKAQLYEQLLEGQFFESDDDVTLQVEAEVKEFVADRYKALLGVKDEKKSKIESVFEDDELKFLKLWIAKIMGKPVAIPKPDEKPAPILAAPRPAPAPVPAGPVLAAPKRGRGRPPGTGKNQRAAAAAAQQARPLPAPISPRSPLNVGPVRATPLAATPAPVRQDPQATTQMRVVTLPNGQIKEIPVQSQRSDPALRPVPMPSGPEMEAIAAQQGMQGFTQSAIGKEQPSALTVVTQNA